MIRGKTSSVGRQLEALWTSGTLTGISDGQLVDRFAADRDAAGESAFRELVERHGPMVMGVCRQILRHPHDADDAFQATFLVLVRKARSIRVGESLAPWLYAVAYRTALRARAIAARYRHAEVDKLEEPMGSSGDDVCQFDLRPLLHEELNRLPGKYRQPIVLCHLEGKTHEEAARLLHWPVGTVSGRLSRGRELLRSRLKRRGMEVSPAVLSANWLAGTPSSVTLPLIESTVAAAIGFAAAQAVSTSVLSLTQGVLKAMLFKKIIMTALIVLFLGGMTAGAGIWAMQASQPATLPVQAGEPPPKTYIKELTRPQGTVAGAALKKMSGRPPRGAGGGMGLSYPPVHLKNSPNIDPRGGLPGIRTASMVLVESPDRNSWQGMSLKLDHPRWSKIQFRPGTTAWPLAGDDIAALTIKGKTIDEVAAFSPYSGNWVAQMLRKPVEDEINPVVGPGYALYQAGNDFYAFTALRGIWGVLHLDGDEEAKASISPNEIEVAQGNRLYVFNLKYGEWSQGVAVYVRPGRAGAKNAKPAGTQKVSR